MDTKSSKDKPKKTNVVPIDKFGHRPEPGYSAEEVIRKQEEWLKEGLQEEQSYDAGLKELMRMNETLEKIWQLLERKL